MNYTFLFGISCDSGREVTFFCYLKYIVCVSERHECPSARRARLLKQPYTMSYISIYFVISFAHVLFHCFLFSFVNCLNVKYDFVKAG